MQNCNDFNQGVADWQRKLGTQWATTPALKSFLVLIGILP